MSLLAEAALDTERKETSELSHLSLVTSRRHFRVTKFMLSIEFMHQACQAFKFKLFST